MNDDFKPIEGDLKDLFFKNASDMTSPVGAIERSPTTPSNAPKPF